MDNQIVTDQQRRANLIDAYRRAGDEHLARRLVRIFTPIQSEADKALHNDALEEIFFILDTKEKKGFFFRSLAGVVLRREKPKKRWLFLRRAAQWVMLAATGKDK